MKPDSSEPGGSQSSKNSATRDDQLGPTPVTVACGCNKTIRDDTVMQEPRYGFFANMTLLFGITAAPKRVDYICLTCGKTIAASTDPASLQKLTGTSQ